MTRRSPDCGSSGKGRTETPTSASQQPGARPWTTLKLLTARFSVEPTHGPPDPALPIQTLLAVLRSPPPQRPSFAAASMQGAVHGQGAGRPQSIPACARIEVTRVLLSVERVQLTVKLRVVVSVPTRVVTDS
jgi:hypothetical protein